MTKNKKTENQNITKAESIISNLINLAGVTIGIIILSIGAIMFFKSIFKLYILDIKQDRYNSFDYQCNIYDIDRIEASRLTGIGDIEPAAINLERKQKENKKLTEEEKEFLRKKYQECKEKVKKENEENFVRGQKIDIADSIAFILVGIPLIYFYQRRRKSKK